MDDRAEFEQWWNDADDPPIKWEMTDHGWVPADHFEWLDMWEAWQAATARQRERDAQPKLCTHKCECGLEFLVEGNVIGRRV